MATQSGDTPLFHEFEHTGDLGIELDAPTREELFRRASLALAAILVEPGDVAAVEQRTIEVAAESDPDALHDLLTALLGLFAVEDFIWCEASVTQEGGVLCVTLRGERFDPNRHVFRGEIKAVTYHQLQVERSDKGWRARVIFDV